MSQKPLTFKKVTKEDSEVLYELLKTRQHSISHNDLPSFTNHKKFMKNKPYLTWYLVSLDKPIGTFYIQDDNSIGMNINAPSNKIVSEILFFIKQNFKPNSALPSKVPPYFYVNIANTNNDMKEIFEKLALKPIQVSFKLD